MSQTTSFIPQPLPQHLQGNIRFQQPGSNNAFVVVDQQPSRREVFPYSLHVNGILAFSILKCIIGSLLFLAGIVNVAVVQYDTKIPFGIWCGLTVSTGIRVLVNICVLVLFLMSKVTLYMPIGL